MCITEIHVKYLKLIIEKAFVVWFKKIKLTVN